MGKLLNVFYAAALDLKTYSVTKIDVIGQVTELQKSLGIIAEYIEMARVELSEQFNFLQNDNESIKQ